MGLILTRKEDFMPESTIEASAPFYKLFLSPDFLETLLKTLIIFVVGVVITKIVLKCQKKFLERSKINKVLFPLITIVTKMLLYVVIFISCVDSLNVPTGSLVTALGAVGLAVSLAVKDSLSNLASGIAVILSQPFTLDDYVKIGDYEGKVYEIGFVYTILLTFDNKRIMIPNSDVFSSKIINFSAEGVRRLDLNFSIGYDDDIKFARKVILDEIKKTNLAESKPAEAFVGVINHGASSIDLQARVWVKTENYWDLSFMLKENVKYAFDENGITIPYNQLDIHINPVVE